jgi:polysaccharide biosynthesis/export protein
MLTFRDTEEFTPLVSHDIENFKRVTIQPDDILMIKVLSIDPMVAEPFNTIPSTNTSLSTENATLMGYLVDPSGFIDFPVLGKMKMAGMTTDEAKSMVIKALAPYIKDPWCMCAS